MKQIKIGVIGCANIADRSVIPALKNLDSEFTLIGIASRSKEKADLFADKFGCKAFYSYESLINNEKIDALYIPLPTGLHQKWINLALNKGKHVYAEKSIASSCSDAEEMIKNAKSNDCALMEGFMFQYHKQHEHLKQLVDLGLIGEIRHFSSSFGFPPLNPNNFRYDKEIGGGALYDAAGYPVRAAFKVLGDNLKIQGASVFYSEKGTSIFGSAYLASNNGVGASLSFGFDNFYQCNYQIWGSKGKITVEKAFTPRPDEITKFTLSTQNSQEIIESFADNHFEKAMLEFSDIINNSKKRAKHFKEILQQSEALEKIYLISKQKS